LKGLLWAYKVQSDTGKTLFFTAEFTIQSPGAAPSALPEGVKVQLGKLDNYVTDVAGELCRITQNG
jgi:hypothetical protein